MVLSILRADRRGGRRQLEAVLERLRKQHEWGVIADSAFLAEHARVKRSLVELGPAAIVPSPSADALKMAAHIGGAWRRVSDETRRRFLGEWFAELRIEADGRVTMVPREPYHAKVYAAVGTVGDAGFELSSCLDGLIREIIRDLAKGTRGQAT